MGVVSFCLLRGLRVGVSCFLFRGAAFTHAARLFHRPYFSQNAIMTDGPMEAAFTVYSDFETCVTALKNTEILQCVCLFTSL